MSTLDVTTIKSKAANTPPKFNDSGDVEVIQGCRAWVNINGIGTPVIRDSFNVSSITDNANGDYTINFAVALPNADYSFAGMVAYGNDATNNVDGLIAHKRPNTTVPTTTTLRVVTGSGGGAPTDCRIVCVSVFANN